MLTQDVTDVAMYCQGPLNHYLKSYLMTTWCQEYNRYVCTQYGQDWSSFLCGNIHTQWPFIVMQNQDSSLYLIQLHSSSAHALQNGTTPDDCSHLYFAVDGNSCMKRWAHKSNWCQSLGHRTGGHHKVSTVQYCCPDGKCRCHGVFVKLGTK